MQTLKPMQRWTKYPDITSIRWNVQVRWIHVMMVFQGHLKVRHEMIFKHNFLSSTVKWLITAEAPLTWHAAKCRGRLTSDTSQTLPGRGTQREGAHHPFTGKGSHSHRDHITLPPTTQTHTPCPQMAGMTVRCSSIMLLNLNPRDWAVLHTTRLSGVRGNISDALYLYQEAAPIFPPLKLGSVNTYAYYS